METKINNDLIRSFKPCYDPSEKNIPDSETLPVLEWVNKYRGIVPDKDIIWMLCRPEFMSDKDLRLFAVWCAREALKLVNNPDERSINACDVAEKFALGEVTAEDLAAAWAAAREAAEAAGWAAEAAAREAAEAAAWESAYSAAWAAARESVWAAAWTSSGAAWTSSGAAWEAQLNKLLNYFK